MIGYAGDRERSVSSGEVEEVVQEESVTRDGVVRIGEGVHSEEEEVARDESPTSHDGVKEDWRWSIIEYRQNPSSGRDKKTRRRALKYVLVDRELHRCTVDSMLLKCLDGGARMSMGEVHEGLCGAHQSAFKMKWTIWRAGLYWPTLMEDCIRYKRGVRHARDSGTFRQRWQVCEPYNKAMAI
jgi:hypothetical protein